jgi:hypothetical protein
LLRTSDALSKAVSAEHIVASLVMFAVIYLFLGAVFFYTLNRKIEHGPDLPAPPAPPSGDGTDSKTTVSNLRDVHLDQLDPSHHPEAGCDGNLKVASNHPHPPGDDGDCDDDESSHGTAPGSSPKREDGPPTYDKDGRNN